VQATRLPLSEVYLRDRAELQETLAQLQKRAFADCDVRWTDPKYHLESSIIFVRPCFTEAAYCACLCRTEGGGSGVGVGRKDCFTLVLILPPYLTALKLLAISAGWRAVIADKVTGNANGIRYMDV
jgi:hypothetical protein